MQDFFIQQSLFICTILILLFIPGMLFMHAFFHKDQFALLEKIILSIPISFVLITLLMIILNWCKIPIDRNMILITTTTLCIFLGAIAVFVKKKNIGYTGSDLFTFSRKHTTTIVLMIIFMIMIKSIYLINTIFPTATDLGHHLYWVETIIQEHHLPTYANSEINSENGHFAISDPVAMPDFIVGEHIFLAVIAIITNLSVISSFPSIFLLVINIFSILVLFVLTRRLFDTHPHGTMIAILTLLFIGPLWAISGAQAKFVSGGVIGNLLGNLLIPTILYFVYRTYREKNDTFFITAILSAVTLAYTHHLSAFIFGYSLAFGIGLFIFLQKDGLRGYIEFLHPLKNPIVITLLVGALLWILILDPPSYLAKDTIASSVGAPIKSTRIGIPFDQLMTMLGDARFVFGVIGIALSGVIALIGRFLSRYTPKNTQNIFATIITLGWGCAPLLMSLIPHILHVNIISSRIATYTAFPLAIFAAFSLSWIIIAALSRKNNTLHIPQIALSCIVCVCMSYIFSSGMRDNATSLNPAPQTNEALQTFHAGKYANSVLKNEIAQNRIWMVKDHNYITADTWLKIFFTYDYAFPLSRAYFARYDSNPDRETCTLEMISAPHTEKAQSCFTDLNVKIILVSTEQDAGQFSTSQDFYRIYQNNELSLFLKK